MYLRKDRLSERQKDHALLLEGFNIRQLVFLKRRETLHDTVWGTFFILNNCGQVVDITWSVAVLFELDMARTATGARVIECGNIVSLARDLSELLYGNWEKITVFVLE